MAYGNFLLLKNPDIAAVKVSRKDTPEILAAKMKDWAETIRGNGVLVSPFIKDEEKALGIKESLKGPISYTLQGIRLQAPDGNRPVIQ